MVDRKKLKNPNGLILGTPGSGKSFSAKREICNAFLVTDDDTLCGVCLRHYVETKAFKIAIVPNKDRCMETCTVCQTRRGYDYVVMPR